MDLSWWASRVLAGIEWSVLLYFVLVNGVYLSLLLAAVRELYRHLGEIRQEDRKRLLASELWPSLSIIVPAHNEQATICSSVHALLALEYPEVEILVINDGSSDDTLSALREAFDLTPVHDVTWERLPTQPLRDLYRSRSHPQLIVADKVNGGKVDALNMGLNLATGTLFCAIDADTLLDPDTLGRIIRPFLADPSVVAAGGTLHVANGVTLQHNRVISAKVSANLLVGIQTVEYLRAFFFGRLGWNRVGGNLVIAGAFGLFRSDAVRAVGGYTAGAEGEDMDLVLKLRRRSCEQRVNHRVVFVPDAVAWTEVPSEMTSLRAQRQRWHRGLADSLLRHRAIFLNPKYGSAGLVAYPYFFLVELCSPVVELLGVLALAVALARGSLNVNFALLFFLVAYGFGLVMSMCAILVDDIGMCRYRRLRDRMLLICWAAAEWFGFRQFTVIWRVWGLVQFVRGKSQWGPMRRRGFPESATPVNSVSVAQP